ncbi:hypothetical protein AGMMS50225_08020 [Betaproteobacteria bacterium]|nr:hypothetical protein AGMMS50225_08020 [Betaproteobacteria bacterium]
MAQFITARRPRRVLRWRGRAIARILHKTNQMSAISVGSGGDESLGLDAPLSWDGIEADEVERDNRVDRRHNNGGFRADHVSAYKATQANAKA